jgi:hypothetical protein
MSSRLSWLAAVVLFSFNLCLGQAPSGTFTLNFNPATTPLIDLAGTFQTSQSIVGAGGAQIPFAFGVDLTNDASGRLRGAGTAIVQVGDDFVAAAYTANGTVTGGGIRPVQVSLSVRLSGEDIVGGQETKFSVSVRYKLTLNTEAGNLQGTARGSAKFEKLGSGQIRENFITVPLPPGVDGSWSASLTVIPLTKLGGTGTISLPNGRMLQGILSGSFSPFTGVSKIRLVGVNESKGINVTFTTTSTEGGVQLETVRGRILGQTVRE